jgi:hypothetical protein
MNKVVSFVILASASIIQPQTIEITFSVFGAKILAAPAYDLESAWHGMRWHEYVSRKLLREMVFSQLF